MITINFNPITEESNISLGNSMFQYTVCRIVAERNGYNFYIPNGQNLLKVFPSLHLGTYDGDIKYVYEDSQNQFNPHIFNIPDFTNIIGHFNTDKYMNEYENKVKNWFSFEADEKTKKIMEKYPTDKFCYIHLRGGDYRTNNWLLPKSYFTDAISHLSQKVKLSFVIITNDLELAESYFPEYDSIYNDVVTDFKLFNLCKYSIISNSGFSWWARWLSDGEITIGPKNWLNYNSPHLGCYPIDSETDKFIYI